MKIKAPLYTDYPLAPSFPRRRESSKTNAPHSGQSLSVGTLRGDYCELGKMPPIPANPNSITWIPACAGMTSFRPNEQFLLNPESSISSPERSSHSLSYENRTAYPLRVQSGFTLIELLVVLVVMGIALGMVVVQLMPDSRAALREEAQRLALLLENAGMEARASGRPLAWSSEKNGYRFWKKNDYGDWVRLEDDAMFRPRTLPSEFHIAEVSVEAQPLKPGEQMSLSASSFALPFRIRLTGEHAGASVTGSSTGAVSAKLDSEN